MSFPDPRVARWFKRRTFSTAEDPAALASAKHDLGVTVSVCLPALNEQDTIGPICSTIRSELMGSKALVDELVVVDSGSEDSTAIVASAAGARVMRADDILPHLAREEGKGEALWKSLAVLEGDLVVWLDSDTMNFHSRFVSNLVAPLLRQEEVVFVKAFYRRPLREPTGELTAGGARVTELTVRPMLSLFYPHLTGFIQPLSGEYAGRRSALVDVPFFTGYGVDIGLLVDLAERHGLDALAQADLGTRVHRNREVQALGRTAFQVLQTMLIRLEDTGVLKLRDEIRGELVQFSIDDGPVARRLQLGVAARPPMATIVGPNI